jgi:hypothetical protein
MHSFTSDKTGHTYTFMLTFGRVEKIKSKHDIDLLEGDEDKIFNELWGRPSVRLEILWDILQDKEELPQIVDPDSDTGKTLSKKASFQEILEGEALKAADKAFWSEIGFFFQNLNPQKAEIINHLKEEMIKFGEKQVAAMIEMSQSGEKERAMDQALEKAKEKALSQLGDMSGKLLDDSNSTPDLTA